MRAQAGRVGLPVETGRAAQFPSNFSRYSAVQSILPFCLTSWATRSSTGSRLSTWPDTYQLGIVTTSCPERAWPSAAKVRSILSPLVLTKSIWRSIFSLAAHASHNLRMAGGTVGVGWSQKKADNLPAAYAPWTKGNATAPVAMAVLLSSERRVKTGPGMRVPPPVTGDIFAQR